MHATADDDSDQSSESGIDFNEIAMDYGDLRNDYTSQLLSTPPPFPLPSLPSPQFPPPQPFLSFSLEDHTTNTAGPSRRAPPHVPSSPLSSVDSSEVDVPLAVQLKQKQKQKQKAKAKSSQDISATKQANKAKATSKASSKAKATPTTTTSLKDMTAKQTGKFRDAS
jgi:hypothetical protein